MALDSFKDSFLICNYL